MRFPRLSVQRLLTKKTNRTIEFLGARRLASTSSSVSSSSSIDEKTANLVPRFNMCGVQMLSKDLKQRLFKRPPGNDIVAPEVAKQIEHTLSSFGLWGRNPPVLKETPTLTDLPQISSSIKGSVEEMAQSQIGGYLDLAVEFSRQSLPPCPSRWEFREGWTRYALNPSSSTFSCDPVDAPAEDAIVFDIENCPKVGPQPVLAVAASEKAWYLWLSSSLVGKGNETSSRELIPLSPRDQPRLVIGHHVSYDRQRVAEEYVLEPNKLRFLDTMSMHTATSGLSTQQHAQWRARQNDFEAGAVRSSDLGYRNPTDRTGWAAASSLSSLADCYQLWCGKSLIRCLAMLSYHDHFTELDKEARSTFVEGTLEDVRSDFQNLATYCAKDVQATHDVFSKVLPEFMRYCPSPISFSGMMQMTKCYLPIDHSWRTYLRKSQETFQQYQSEIQKTLLVFVDDAKKKVSDSSWKGDPWLKHLDWTAIPQQYTKAKLKADGTYAKNGEPRPKKQRLPGQPQWYRDIATPKDNAPDEISISLRQDIAPCLYRMEYVPDLKSNAGYPLYFHSTLKWGYLVPKTEQHKGNGPHDWQSLNDKMHETHQFFKLPHPDGAEANCGSPFSKSYLHMLQSGALRSPFPEVTKALQNTIACSYWMSSHDRIESQYTVWETEVPAGAMRWGVAPKSTDPVLGAIIPQLVPAGTVTRRAVERTWLTASNPKKDRIGSELKAMVRAPPSFCFVGADVDSQELWISAILGEAYRHKIHGSSPLGWMTLQGSKADGTDMHSQTAKILGITRDQAKIVNYARIYGAGVKFTISLLQQFNTSSTLEDATQRANLLFAKTKGTRLNSTKGALSEYSGGSESDTFNALEGIAYQNRSTTPVLGCRVSAGLQKGKLSGESQFMTSRVNWVVQSSAVDYLHIMLVVMQHLMEKHKIKGRFCISIHDEIRYLVAYEDRYRAALALQITNLLTRAMFAEQLGMHDLPQSVAFFSLVDIDHVLRKEVSLSCVTPSNPTPISPGEALDIYQIGEKTNWRL